MTTTAPERPAGSYLSLGPTRAGVTSRIRGLAPWVVILLLGALALVALGAGTGPQERLLDPRSPAPVGGRALAEVLREAGVEVSVIGSIAEAPRLVPAGTTVVVTADDRISTEALGELAERAAAADRLVVLLTRPQPVGALDPALSGYVVPQVPSAPAAGCPIPVVRAGDVVAGGTVMMLPEPTETTESAEPTQPGGASRVTCLPAQGVPDGGALLTLLPAGADRPETLLVGFAAGLANQAITSEDNAAVALRMLGGSPRLTWLIPSGADQPTDATGDAVSAWPPWTTPVALVLALGTVLLAAVRGRRLGRVVPEPLPVVVRAAETTESRGHLYRRSKDLARTATVLRDGTRTRLRHRLGVARTDPLDVLVLAVAAATGEPRDRVELLLGDTAPGSDADLVALASDLALLEGKVRLT
jgi:hypothetical protein